MSITRDIDVSHSDVTDDLKGNILEHVATQDMYIVGHRT